VATPEADTAPRVTAHSVKLSDLACNTVYHYRVLSKDASGNQGLSPAATFTTAPCPPVLSAVQATVLFSTSASITWITDKPASSLVRYGLTSSYTHATSETDTSPRATFHSVTLTGLLCATTYHYLVSSTDSLFHAGASADGTFTTR